MLVAATEALRSLSSCGLNSADRLDHAANLCREHAKVMGEIRYLLVCESLKRIASDWREYGAFPESVIEILDDILCNELPAIIDTSPSQGVLLADQMKREINSAISAWERTL